MNSERERPVQQDVVSQTIDDQEPELAEKPKSMFERKIEEIKPTLDDEYFEIYKNLFLEILAMKYDKKIDYPTAHETLHKIGVDCLKTDHSQILDELHRIQIDIDRNQEIYQQVFPELGLNIAREILDGNVESFTTRESIITAENRYRTILYIPGQMDRSSYQKFLTRRYHSGFYKQVPSSNNIEDSTKFVKSERPKRIYPIAVKRFIESEDQYISFYTQFSQYMHQRRNFEVANPSLNLHGLTEEEFLFFFIHELVAKKDQVGDPSSLLNSTYGTFLFDELYFDRKENDYIASNTIKYSPYPSDPTKLILKPDDDVSRYRPRFAITRGNIE